MWAGVFAYWPDADGNGSTTVYTDAVGATTVYGFDTDLRPRAVADQAGRVTYSGFNAQRDPLSITDAGGGVTRFAYTEGGDLAEVVDALGRATRIDYTATAVGDRPAQLIGPDGTTTSCTGSSGNGVQRWVAGRR